MGDSGRCVIGSVVVIAIVGVGIGIIIGYFAIKQNEKNSSTPATTVTDSNQQAS
jgi:uncharacterized membrane protein